MGDVEKLLLGLNFFIAFLDVLDNSERSNNFEFLFSGNIFVPEHFFEGGLGRENFFVHKMCLQDSFFVKMALR